MNETMSSRFIALQILNRNATQPLEVVC
jgi:hypothetical protein